MMITAETESKVPAEWQSILNDNPTDMTVRLVLADWYEENDDSLAAECLRWSVAKERISDKGSWANEDSETKVINCRLPRALFEVADLSETSVGYRDNDDWCHLNGFRRLIVRWKRTTIEQHIEFWSWNPDGVTE